MDISLNFTVAPPPITNYNQLNDSQSSSDKSNSSISEFVRQLNGQSFLNVTDSDCSFELQQNRSLMGSSPRKHQNLSKPVANSEQYKNYNPTGPKGYDILKDPIYTNIIWDNLSPMSLPMKQSTPHKLPSTSSIYHDRPTGFPILAVPNYFGKRKTNCMSLLRMEDPYLREIQMAIYDVRSNNSGNTKSFQQPIDYYKSAENYALYCNILRYQQQQFGPGKVFTHLSQ